MDREHSPLPVNREDGEITKEEKLAWNHAEIRREAKDLRTIIQQTPTDFPHRERLIRLADEVLGLVPVYNPADEARDEQKRDRLQREVEAAATEWEERTK